MAGSIVVDEKVEAPLGIGSLADFRRWILSAEAPHTGRVDYLSGRIEVETAPEDLYCHGTVKNEMIAALLGVVKPEDLGSLFSDQTRVSHREADLSVEPDIVFVSREALESGSVRLVPKAGDPDRYVELEGAPDLVVEIVSDNSVSKDTRRLPLAYFSAGVREYWLVDARSEELFFQIHARDENGFTPVLPDVDGFQFSSVLSRRFQLTRRRSWMNLWQYDLLVEPAKGER